MKLVELDESHMEDLLPLVAEYHAFEGIQMSDQARRRALAPLLCDDRLGRVWAIEEAGAWAGYIALTWGYSIEFQGRDAFIDELYLSARCRGRGLGTRALEAVKTRVVRSGIRALHLEVNQTNAAARALYGRLGFELRDHFSLMSLKLDKAAR